MSIIKTFAPHFARECPYSGRMEIIDLKPNEFMAMFPYLAPSGNGTYELEVFNDRGELLMHPKVYVTITK